MSKMEISTQDRTHLGHSQTLNLRWAREEHFLNFLLFSQVTSFSSSICSPGLGRGVLHVSVPLPMKALVTPLDHTSRHFEIYNLTLQSYTFVTNYFAMLIVIFLHKIAYKKSPSEWQRKFKILMVVRVKGRGKG